ncbi:hypothetical protein PoB_002562500 [Plakobranchus ocellatus]|uniref:Uncharacterized protein n=1 Tax=Plakobranchus ocellatus TaxID=259542 RepID=A0AAV3ZVB1_9GAST|nr:hypothetical protein PoB_002562500 [Plakobranchus ocellatus]
MGRKRTALMSPIFRSSSYRNYSVHRFSSAGPQPDLNLASTQPQPHLNSPQPLLLSYWKRPRKKVDCKMESYVGLSFGTPVCRTDPPSFFKLLSHFLSLLSSRTLTSGQSGDQATSNHYRLEPEEEKPVLSFLAGGRFME